LTATWAIHTFFAPKQFIKDILAVFPHFEKFKHKKTYRKDLPDCKQKIFLRFSARELIESARIYFFMFCKNPTVLVFIRVDQRNSRANFLTLALAFLND
jgi:hypothetical protein